jgi:hypothetical protein
VCDHDVDKTVARENQALTCSSTGTALYNLHPEVKKIDPIPLLSSCGQIHAEGESVLYGSNVFCIESVQDLRCFLGGRTIHQLEQIRAISLFITADLESYFSALERTMNPTWQCEPRPDRPNGTPTGWMRGIHPPPKFVCGADRPPPLTWNFAAQPPAS